MQALMGFGETPDQVRVGLPQRGSVSLQHHRRLPSLVADDLVLGDRPGRRRARRYRPALADALDPVGARRWPRFVTVSRIPDDHLTPLTPLDALECRLLQNTVGVAP